jgi:hypothetical protein
MFKKILIITAFLAVAGLLVFGAVNRTFSYNGNDDASLGGNGRGRTNNQSSESSNTGLGSGVNGYGRGQGASGYGAGEQAYLPPATPGDLSADESAALLYMREEEKLAHDVYVTLYAQYGLPVFQNISQSEQTHTDAVKTLIERYALSDPAASQVGVFTNPDLQALYNDLTARGSQSLAEALKVGGAIEEIDILDLQKRLAQTDNADIQQVFNNLLAGSSNHLRAFSSTFTTQTGETYQPQYLSAEAYQSILNSSTGNGRNGGGKGQGGYRGGRK